MLPFSTVSYSQSTVKGNILRRHYVRFTLRTVLSRQFSDFFGKYCFEKNKFVAWSSLQTTHSCIQMCFEHSGIRNWNYIFLTLSLDFSRVKLRSFLMFAQQIRQGDGSLRSTPERNLLQFLSVQVTSWIMSTVSSKHVTVDQALAMCMLRFWKCQLVQRLLWSSQIPYLPGDGIKSLEHVMPDNELWPYKLT